MYRICVLFLMTLCLPALVQPSESNNTTSGSPDDVVCITNADCIAKHVCIEQKCVDPCLGVCGPNTTCTLVDTTPLCSCKDGFTGHAFTGCHPLPGVYCSTDDECPLEEGCKNKSCVDACKNICGSNSICKAINHRPVCSCSPGYHWTHFSGCVTQNEKENITDEVLPKKKFYFVNRLLNWYKAGEACRAMNMHLASIANMVEEDELIKEIRGGYNVWVSGSDLGSKGEHVWASTGHPLTYTNWVARQPGSNDKYRCIWLRHDSNYAWSMGECTVPMMSVCEYY